MTEEAENAGPLVLVVEDEPQVRKFLRAGLPAHGYRLVEATTGEEALRLAVQHVPEVVLLDLGLPDIDGLEVTRRLREWTQIPILVISARGQEAQKVEALDAGADDYLTKPFGFPELLARMRASLRRATVPESGESTFLCHWLKVDLAARRVFVDDREVHLTPIEYKLLTTLVRHAGKVVTHRQLLQQVWGPHNLEQTHYLRVHMTHLRRKVEREPAQPKLLLTEAGVGYRLQLEE